MKKLDRIEDLVNRVIIKLKHSCVSFLILAWKSVIPLKLQNKLGHIYDRLEKKQSELKQKLVQTSSKVKKDLSTRTKNIVHKAQDKKKLVSAKVKQIKSKSKDINYKEVTPKKVWLLLLGVVAPIWKKLHLWLSNINPQTFALGFTVSAVGFIAGIGIYKNTQKIHQKGSEAYREVASEVNNATALSSRPDYHKLYEKHLTINQFTLPGYSNEKQRKFKNLIIDFTITTSNRYLKSYFSENEDKIRSRLYTNIEAIELSFPIKSEEGKEIIREKIQQEVNKLIEDLGAKGDVAEVSIISILGA